MDATTLRSQLHQQIDRLPNESLAVLADLATLVEKHQTKTYSDWDDAQWQEFALAQFFRGTEDDVEYSLDDAWEVYVRSPFIRKA